MLCSHRKRETKNSLEDLWKINPVLLKHLLISLYLRLGVFGFCFYVCLFWGFFGRGFGVFLVGEIFVEGFLGFVFSWRVCLGFFGLVSLGFFFVCFVF